MQTVAPVRTVNPVSEPLTLTQVKKHLEIATLDTQHDEQLADLIKRAREQVEHDTDLVLFTSTWNETFEEFDDCCLKLSKRPIQSVTSIVYRSGESTTTTLSSSIYSLDAARRQICLKYNQVWPTVYGETFDAISVTYVAGYTSLPEIPGVAKQAMLLLIGYYFENRDMHSNETMYNRKAYDDLIQRLYRSSYP